MSTRMRKGSGNCELCCDIVLGYCEVMVPVMIDSVRRWMQGIREETKDLIISVTESDELESAFCCITVAKARLVIRAANCQSTYTGLQ
ncbi:MAG: hypothetical protein ACLTS6_17580 [Anaerobutyricum sp.]